MKNVRYGETDPAQRNLENDFYAILGGNIWPVIPFIAAVQSDVGPVFLLAGKRTKEFRRDFLRNLVVACTTETIPLYSAECVCIAVVKLTSLIAEVFHRFAAPSSSKHSRRSAELGQALFNSEWILLAFFWWGSL